MGEEAKDILESFGLNETDVENYSVVEERFTRHLVKQRNPIYERALFNQRTVDASVTTLHTIDEQCGYCEFPSQTVLDRIVVETARCKHVGTATARG